MKVTVTISGRFYHLGPTLTGELELPTGATVDDALCALQQDDSRKRNLVPFALLAVSGQHIGTIDDHAVHNLEDADELLIFAPVAGG